VGGRPRYQITDPFLAVRGVKWVVQIFRFLSIGIMKNDPVNTVGRRARASREGARQNPQGRSDKRPHQISHPERLVRCSLNEGSSVCESCFQLRTEQHKNQQVMLF
jgi:hypothetical protein